MPSEGPGQSWRRSPQTPLTLSVLMKQQLTQDWLDATCADANELGGLCKYVHLRMPHHPHLLRSLPRAKQSLDMLWHCRPLPLILRLYNAWRVVKTYSAVQVRRPAHGARQHFYAGLEGLSILGGLHRDFDLPEGCRREDQEGTGHIETPKAAPRWKQYESLPRRWSNSSQPSIREPSTTACENFVRKTLQPDICMVSLTGTIHA